MNASARKPRRSIVVVLVGFAMVLGAALVAVEGARFSRAPGPTVDAPATLQKLLEEGSQERHAIYAYLRADAPGARVVLIDDGGPTLDPLSLRTLAGASRVETAPSALTAGGGSWIPERQPDARGRLRDDAWDLYRETGPIDTVVVGSLDGRVAVVDRRSAPALNLPAWEGVREAPEAPSSFWAVTIESGLLVAVLLAGGLVLPRRLGPRPLRPVLAVLAGAAVQAVTAHLFLAGAITPLIGPVLVGGVAWWLWRHGAAPGWRRSDLPGLLVATVTITGIVLTARLGGLVTVSADAIAHVTRAIAMSGGTMGLTDLNEKRPLALAAIHAPAHALGIEGLHALGWVLLVAAGILIGAVPFLLVRGPVTLPRWPVMLAASFAVGAMALVPMLRTMAAFLNTHLLVGALLLLLAVLWALDDAVGPRRDLAPVASLVLLALVPTRAESVLIVGLVLLATLAAGSPRPDWPWVWPVVGFGLAVWNGLHVVAAAAGGARPSLPVTALTVVGPVIAVAGPIVLRVPARARRGLARGVLAGLWVLSLAVLTSRIGSGGDALEALRVNIGEGGGGWGVFAPLLVVLIVVALVTRVPQVSDQVLLARWLILGAFPTVLLAKAGDGTDQLEAGGVSASLEALLTIGGRAGSWGDSVNRMWTHFVPVALLLIGVLLVSAFRDQPSPIAGRASGRARSSGRAPRHGYRSIVALGTLVSVLTLAWWRPAHLGPASPGTEVNVLGHDGQVAGESSVATGSERGRPELIAGRRVAATLTVRAVDVPDDGTELAVCGTFPFTDLGRVVTSETRVGLSGPAGTVTRTFDEVAWQGERVEELCLEVADAAELPATVTVWAEGLQGARAGGSAVVLAPEATAPVEALTVRYVAASEDPRGTLMRAASVLLRTGIRTGPTIVGLLLVLALYLHRRPQRHREGPAAPDGTAELPSV